MYGVLFGIILALGGAGYWYYDTTQDQLNHLRTKSAALEAANEAQRQTITDMQESAQAQAESINELTLANQEAEREMSRYLSIFQRHNLTKLAAAKPGLIETRVNRGTKDVFDSIEAASRSIDRLDDGVQLAPTTGAGSGNTDQDSTSADNTASTTEGN
jgi:hypothetical protein